VLVNGQEGYRDSIFYSQAFQTERPYRIYLPASYDKNKHKRYPVVYYFHGYGGRYKWDSYELEDDVHFPGNGRKEPPFVMEWKAYTEKNDVIIVTWDGYEPNLHPGKRHREGIDYGNCLPYDYIRAHEKNNPHFGWDYRLYFQDLVQHIDSYYRTLSDRDHRAVTGLSMGGLTSYYIAGQNKDLVSAVSSFDPAANEPYYGPKGKQVVFPILQMHRSLKGLAVRLTMTDGDWLKYNDWKMKRIFSTSDISSFDFHLADYPDHWTADPHLQLDWHMKEFGKHHPVPTNWNHISPAFSNISTWDYSINVNREEPALTILEDVSPTHMKILSRAFIPDGPIVQNEDIDIRTAPIYIPNHRYEILTYDLSNHTFQKVSSTTSKAGTLHFRLPGGGHLMGINNPAKPAPVIQILQHQNKEHFYFEEGQRNSLNFQVLNLGNADAENITIEASTQDPGLSFMKNKTSISSLKSQSIQGGPGQFDFTLSAYSDTSYIGSILLEIKMGTEVLDSHRITYFPTPKAPFTDENDIIFLDGGTAEVPIYLQGIDTVVTQSISGGSGNGNGILEAGEKALVYIRLPKGMGEKDLNTWHRTYLLNALDIPEISVDSLHYEEVKRQASTTSMATYVGLESHGRVLDFLDLWFRVESVFNDTEDPTSKATIYAHKYDYRRYKLSVK